jgi:hypothetical protein
MFTHPLQQVEVMVATDCSFESIEDFIENETHLSEDARSALWLLAWIKIGRQHPPPASGIDNQGVPPEAHPVA